MKMMIYAVKKGRKTGIYDEWKKCSEQVNRFSGATYHSFPYRTELKDDEEGSLQSAFKKAERYMEDTQIGGVSLVYRGGKGDYAEQDGWKNEGFLPFEELDFEEDTEEYTPDQQDLYQLLHINPQSLDNDVLVEMFMYLTTCNAPYVGRYHAVTLYTYLIGFLLRPGDILGEFYDVFINPRVDRNRMDASEAAKADAERWDWIDRVMDLLQGIYLSEISDLAKRIETPWMDAMDLNELRARCQVIADKDNQSLPYVKPSYMAMKGYMKQGGHSLIDLYMELTENDVYRKELIRVSGPFVNPDLEEPLHKKASAVSFKELAMHTASIGVELKRKVIGQDDAIDKLEKAFFHAENRACLYQKRRGPRSVFLFVGPSGVGKTFTAQLFADKLGVPFRRFDMSGYSGQDAERELQGWTPQYKNTNSGGLLTEFVAANPRCVLLFDEIEKAGMGVIRLLLQILDDGVCRDRFQDEDVSFEDAVIIFTTNAGGQRYIGAENENLTMLPDKVVLEALENDINPATGKPYFPPEIISRLSSHTVIMMNHLKAGDLLRVVERDIKEQLEAREKDFGCCLTAGQNLLAQTVLYSMGGSADAGSASILAGKLIGQHLYEIMTLIIEHDIDETVDELREIKWECDFRGATAEVKQFYFGEGKREEDLEQSYLDTCCHKVMETLSLRHQVLSYKTKAQYDEENGIGRIIFYDLKLDTAVESEDR